MPQIKQYESNVSELRPDERGIDATLQVARRGGAFFNQAADAVRTVGNETGRMVAGAIRDAGAAAVDYAQHQEISHGALAESALTAQKTKQLADAINNADPNDPNVVPKFMEGLNADLDKFKDSFLTEKGQEFAERRTEALRNHFQTSSTAEMSRLAGAAIDVNAKQMLNNWSNTAMTDPASVDTLLAHAGDNLRDLVNTSPNLGAAKGGALIKLSEAAREQIVKAGAIGAIQRAANPEGEAKRWGEKYPQYINGADLKQLEGNARQQIRADRTDRAYADHIQKQEAQDRSDAAETDVLQKLYSGDPKQQQEVSTKAVVNNPNLTRVSKERLINVVERETKPETAAKVSNQNYIDVLSGIRNGTISDVDPIYKARQDGKLNRADFNQALKDFSEYKSPQGEALGKDRAEFFKRYAPAIDPSMGDPQSMTFGHFSALGSQKMYEAEKAARRAEEDARKKGQDPHTVYDPSSPNFFGRPENVAKYRAALDEIKAYQDRIQKAGSEAEFKPKPDWQFSPSRNQYRDPQTGKIYSATGQEIK